MVQDTPYISGIVCNLILNYDTIFLVKTPRTLFTFLFAHVKLMPDLSVVNVTNSPTNYLCQTNYIILSYFLKNKEIAETVAVVLYDYAAQDSSELTLTAGEHVKVLFQGIDGWWEVCTYCKE